LFVSPGFDIALAEQLAALVLAAYDASRTPAARRSQWPLPSRWELCSTFSARLPFHDTETFGFVVRDVGTGDAYVAFRGTEDLDDWLINVEVRQVAQQHGWGMVESGFSDVYDQCSPVIRETVSRLSANRVYVTGHSLGSALATLCAADLKAALGITPILYTFASPRTGDRAFATRFNAECPDTWRVANTEDIITTVPPATSVIETGHPDLLATIIRFLARLPLAGRWLRHRVGLTRMWRSDDVYEHVGAPVVFTKNNGTVLANHDMAVYVAALPAQR
jgi:triacylglycerol lipase